MNMRLARGLPAALLLFATMPAVAADILSEFSQAESRDASGRITVEESVIHVVACNGPGENGGSYYVYEYVNRPGYRAILPPNWGSPIGGRDFDSMDEAIAAACGTAGRGDGMPLPIPPGNSAQSYRGQIGKQLAVTCEPGFSLASVWGTDVYTDDSDICSAAVHAGMISQAGGGTVVIAIAEGQPGYVGSERNGVTSSDWSAWPGGYYFVGD